jgi:hypothetical protein
MVGARKNRMNLKNQLARRLAFPKTSLVPASRVVPHSTLRANHEPVLSLRASSTVGPRDFSEGDTPSPLG